MASGVDSFLGERLSQARKARGLMSISLAELADVSQATISLYEKGTQKPRQETLDRLAVVLKLPVSYFITQIEVDTPERLFYRSMSAATKASRERAESKYEWYLEIVDYLLHFFDFPEPNIPDLDVPSDFRSLDNKTIDSIAERLRQFWLLGEGPIVNMVRTLESNGIVVWRTALGAKTLDAFSDITKSRKHPVVVLSSDKENYFRSRADAAHELGHLILHSTVDKKTLSTTSEFKLLENQANYFAGSFLLPAASYEKDLSSYTLETYRALKPKWNTSIAMQVMRSKQLNLIDENQAKRLWINLSRRGWKKREPLDDSISAEFPSLVPDGIKMLIDEGVKTPEQIQLDLNKYYSDIEILCNLKEGFLNTKDIAPKVKLKKRNDNITPFRR